MAYLLGWFIGTLAISGLISRLARRLFFRNAGGWQRPLVPNVIALVIGTVLNAYGLADEGEPPQYLAALILYLPAVLVWTVVDSVQAHKAQTSHNA